MQNQPIQNQAVDQLKRAIQHDPDDPGTHYELGNLLLQHGQADAAITSYRTALKLASGHPQILLQLGNAFSSKGKYPEAISYFQQSIQSDASDIAAHYNLGNALREMGQPEQAATSYRKALKLNPRDADTHNNLGNVLREMGRLDEAIASYEEALRLNPALHHARTHLLHQRQHICDWRGLEIEVAEIRRLVREEPTARISPFAFLSMPGITAAEQRRCAENWVANRYVSLMEEGRQMNNAFAKTAKARLRIGYLSGDFRLHPLAFLTTELFELHDRAQFEIFAYSYGVDDQTSARNRLEAAFDHFVDIRPLSLHEAARRIHDDDIDILVDLTGFTQSSRTGILALRPAPIQVNWLGFPGTMGAPFADHLISDGFITPPDQSHHYSEQLIRLPDTYQPNDRLRPVAPTPNRSACGLPEDGFVFCSFNQTFKITPHVFDLWLNLLNEKSGSVLWLLDCNPWAKANLITTAKTRGIAANRLIFAPRVSIEQHLARQKLADLFLDTLPYNAHTTASDALWVGLPVITCAGETFSSRVAGSLLHAAALPELVTSSLDEYASRALHLATHPNELQSIRRRLEQSRDQLPLFDTTRFARHLEAAYSTMWQQWIA